MKPVFQIFLNGRTGDCLRACVASVLDLELADVPNFVTMGSTWYDAFVAFLWRYDLFPVYIIPEIAEQNGTAVYGYHLIQGKSPRGIHDHVIVGLNGKPVHDPYPDGNCVLETQRYFIVFASLMGGDPTL